MDDKRKGFRDSLVWASNFNPVEIEYEGVVYPSVEHAYQAAKTDNQSLRLVISRAATPADAKRLGRRAPLRFGWERGKIEVMYNLLWQKFSIPYYRDLLLETGEMELIEWNTWHDEYWGVDRYTGQGQNKLGQLLMRIRDEIQATHVWQKPE